MEETRLRYRQQRYTIFHVQWKYTVSAADEFPLGLHFINLNISIKPGYLSTLTLIYVMTNHHPVSFCQSAPRSWVCVGSTECGQTCACGAITRTVTGLIMTLTEVKNSTSGAHDTKRSRPLRNFFLLSMFANPTDLV